MNNTVPINCPYLCPCGANDKGGSNLSEGVCSRAYKYDELRQVILEYFNDYNIHPYSAGLDDIWPLAKIRVRKDKKGWELEK